MKSILCGTLLLFSNLTFASSSCEMSTSYVRQGLLTGAPHDFNDVTAFMQKVEAALKIKGWLLISESASDEKPSIVFTAFTSDTTVWLPWESKAVAKINAEIKLKDGSFEKVSAKGTDKGSNEDMSIFHTAFMKAGESFLIKLNDLLPTCN